LRDGRNSLLARSSRPPRVTVRVSLTPRPVHSAVPIAIPACDRYSAGMPSCELLEPSSELHRRPRRSRADTAPVVLSILGTTGATPGTALVEYALIIALVAVFTAATMVLVGTQVSQVLSIVGNALT
jgi:Flp pilus assembly pilin Flp